MTIELFREDGYAKHCQATITNVYEQGFSCDQTVFYPFGGGQPGDTGNVTGNAGIDLRITDTIKDRDTGALIHCMESNDLSKLNTGDTVTLTLNWERRYRLMRMHSCLHMLCATIPAPVTGGSIQERAAGSTLTCLTILIRRPPPPGSMN